MYENAKIGPDLRLGVYNLYFLAKVKSKVTLYRDARGQRKLAEREVRLATILRIFNTAIESDHIRD